VSQSISLLTHGDLVLAVFIGNRKLTLPLAAPIQPLITDWVSEMGRHLGVAIKPTAESNNCRICGRLTKEPQVCLACSYDQL